MLKNIFGSFKKKEGTSPILNPKTKSNEVAKHPVSSKPIEEGKTSPEIMKKTRSNKNIKLSRFEQTVLDLQTKSQITEIDLSKQNITDDNIEELVKVLSNAPLESLDLSENKITDKGVKLLVEAIKKHPKYERKDIYLSLTDNDIGRDGVKELIKCYHRDEYSLQMKGHEFYSNYLEFQFKLKRLENNLKLVSTHADFSKLYLSDKEINELVDGIKKNTILETLDLSNNLITDAGAELLANAIANRINGQPDIMLILSNNRISEKGIQALTNVYSGKTQLLNISQQVTSFTSVITINESFFERPKTSDTTPEKKAKSAPNSRSSSPESDLGYQSDSELVYIKK